MTNQTTLSKRPFGSTGYQVTPVCVGCAPLGDMPETFAYGVSEDQALATLRAVFAGSINFLDTAAIYGFGESERRIGKALAELGGLPEGFVLATKADRDPDTGDFSGDQFKRSVEGSLTRLGLDHLQYVYIHDPEHTTFDQIMKPGGAHEVLLGYREQGVIGGIGISGGPIDMLIRYVETGLFGAVETHNRDSDGIGVSDVLLDAASDIGADMMVLGAYGHSRFREVVLGGVTRSLLHHMTVPVLMSH